MFVNLWESGMLERISKAPKRAANLSPSPGITIRSTMTAEKFLNTDKPFILGLGLGAFHNRTRGRRPVREIDQPLREE
jgi:Na+-transporting methylmalonyl-CoA/oxaloacetate decarboxylase beta subunit